MPKNQRLADVVYLLNYIFITRMMDIVHEYHEADDVYSHHCGRNVKSCILAGMWTNFLSPSAVK